MLLQRPPRPVLLMGMFFRPNQLFNRKGQQRPLPLLLDRSLLKINSKFLQPAVELTLLPTHQLKAKRHPRVLRAKSLLKTNSEFPQAAVELTIRPVRPAQPYQQLRGHQSTLLSKRQKATELRNLASLGDRALRGLILAWAFVNNRPLDCLGEQTPITLRPKLPPIIRSLRSH